MIAYLAGLGIALDRGNFRLGSASGVVAWELARQGLGIAMMMDDVAARAPEVEPVLGGTVEVTFPVWLATHRELRTSRRIRVVFDQLAGFFRKAGR